jgi:hypothetical protein
MPDQNTTRWARVVRRIGGVYEVGPLLVAITDQGALWAWRRVVRGSWNA